MYLRSYFRFDSIKSTVKVAGASLGLLLLAAPSPARAESAPNIELVPEIAVEVPVEVPVELGSTDGGADATDGGADSSPTTDGPLADNVPRMDAGDARPGTDAAPSADAARDAASQEESDGDCGCSLGGAGKRG